MWSEAQVQYLETVLGVSATQFAIPADIRTASAHDVVVLTGPLLPDESALLKKILASIQLTQFTHLEASDKQLPDGIQARNILLFGAPHVGLRETDGAKWWGLPPLTEMLGASTAVNEKKKSAWAVLQRFQGAST